jgi:bifunctional non-homologous end joining protein LigD
MEALLATSPPIRMRTDGLIAFDADARGALALRRVLEQIGLPAFVKTGEANDFHVIAPVGEAPSDGARALAEVVVRLAEGGVRKVTASPILAPYSPIGGLGSRVSTPVAWSEVTPALDPKRLTTRTVPARLAEGGDPMAGLAGAQVEFTDVAHRLEEVVARRPDVT